MPSPRLASLTRLLLSVLVSALLAGLAVEGLIRAFDLFAVQREAAAAPGGTAVEEGAEKPTEDATEASAAGSSRLQLHPFVGYTHRPGDFDGVRFNELGYPDRSGDPQQWRSERYVVAIFGASVAMGVAKHGAVILREELEEHFPELRGQVDIVSFALGGYKQPQQLFLLQQTLLLAIPIDAVLNLDGFNELAIGQADTVAGRHPFFPGQTRWPGLALASSSVTDADSLRWAGKALAARERAAAWRHSLKASRWLRRSALLATFVGSQVIKGEATAHAAEEALAAGANSGKAANLFFSLKDPCLRVSDGTRCRELIARIWHDASLQMDAVCRQADIPYLHFLQPNQYVEGGKPLSDEERRVAFRPQIPWSVGSRLGYPLLQQRGEDLRRRIDFHDLSMLFRDHPGTLYRDSCCHFHPEGYRLIAQAMARELIAAIEARRAAGEDATS